MVRKSLFLSVVICLFLLTCPVNAGMLIGSGAVGGDYCDGKLGSYEFYWDADHTSGDLFACISGGTKEGTQNGGTISDTQDHTTGSGESFYFDDPSKYISWAISSGDVWNSSEGYILLWVYYTLDGTNVTVFWDVEYDSNNFQHISADGSERVRFYHYSSAAGSADGFCQTDTNAITIDSWNKIEAWWDSTGDNIYLEVNDTAQASDSTATCTFSNEPTAIRVGTVGVIDMERHEPFIDDVYVETTFPGAPF